MIRAEGLEQVGSDDGLDAEEAHGHPDRYRGLGERSLDRAPPERAGNDPERHLEVPAAVEEVAGPARDREPLGVGGGEVRDGGARVHEGQDPLAPHDQVLDQEPGPAGAPGGSLPGGRRGDAQRPAGKVEEEFVAPEEVGSEQDVDVEVRGDPGELPDVLGRGLDGESQDAGGDGMGTARRGTRRSPRPKVTGEPVSTRTRRPSIAATTWPATKSNGARTGEDTHGERRRTGRK